MNKIAIFYHVFVHERWELICSEQIHRLYASGLYGVCDFVHVGVNVSTQAQTHRHPYTDTMFRDGKFRVQSNQHIHTETETLKALRDFCKNNEDYKVLYFHTLGGSNNYLNKQNWRLYLEYFVVDKWKECIELLNSYDCVGAEYHQHRNIYSGNFWWATAKHINALHPNFLDSLEIEHKNYRNLCEIWVTRGKEDENGNCDQKVYSFKSFEERNLHCDLVLPQEYIN